MSDSKPATARSNPKIISYRPDAARLLPSTLSPQRPRADLKRPRAESPVAAPFVSGSDSEEGVLSVSSLRRSKRKKLNEAVQAWLELEMLESSLGCLDEEALVEAVAAAISELKDRAALSRIPSYPGTVTHQAAVPAASAALWPCSTTMADLPAMYTLGHIDERNGQADGVPPSSFSLCMVYDEQNDISSTSDHVALRAATFSPVDFAPIDYSPVSNSPVEYSPVEYSPTDFAPVEFKPIDYSPVEYSPTDYSPTDFAPVDFVPIDYSPVEYSPTDLAPVDYSTVDFASTDFAPTEFALAPSSAATSSTLDFAPVDLAPAPSSTATSSTLDFAPAYYRAAFPCPWALIGSTRVRVPDHCYNTTLVGKWLEDIDNGVHADAYAGIIEEDSDMEGVD
ncbi:hypothetical protein SVAN01_04920 [Stagonosporopsis vannaccii]|nr:hypothetical protein SVAN01_04920 [Stagonosporopsis vannaccii]